MKLKSTYIIVFLFISIVLFSQSPITEAQKHIEEVLKKNAFKKYNFAFGAQRYGSNLFIKQFFNFRYKVIPQKISSADSIILLHGKECNL